MDETTSFILASVIIGPFFAFLIWRTYSYERERLGVAVAKKLFPKRLMLIGVNVAILSLLPSQGDIRDSLLIICLMIVIIAFGILTIRLSFTQSIKEGILFDLGEANKTTSGGVAATFGVIAFILLILAVVMIEYRIKFLVVGLMFLSLAVYTALYYQKAQVLITESGFVNGTDKVKWEQIKGYMWAKSKEEKTILVFQKRVSCHF